jgi:putative molybdopterin biosynthesis protein
MHDKPLRERVALSKARAIVREHARPTESERADTEASLGRVTAEPVRARLASPAHRVSAMDGVAVRACDTTPAAETPVVLRTDADGAKCVPIDTGGAVPAWADAVVRIENARTVEGGFEIRAAVHPGRDVRAVGEDIAAGAVLLGRGQVIGAYDVGAMLATGVAHVLVRRAPEIAVIATGSEVIEPLGEGETPRPGQVIEFNSRVLAADASSWGARVRYLGRAPDDLTVLAELILASAAKHDVVCVIAGSSAGRRDLTVEALGRCGDLLFHGVDVMPGKPAAFGRVDGTPVLCVPGYPVSAAIVYRELLRPLIDACLGRRLRPARKVSAQVHRKIPSRLGVEELLRVCVVYDEGGLVVAPLPRGAGSISTLMRAHGLLRIPPTCEGFASGSVVDVELLEPDFDATAAVVVANPPEPLTAALEDVVARLATPARFSHLGLAEHDAIAALRAGESHLAVVGGASSVERVDGAACFVLTADGGVACGTLVASASFTRSALGQCVLQALCGDEFAAEAARALELADPVRVSARTEART